MSQENKKNKNLKRKPNIIRIATCCIGGVIVLVLEVTIITFFIKKSGQESSEEQVNINTGFVGNENILEDNLSNINDEPEEVSEEPTEFVEEESITDSENVEEESISDNESIEGETTEDSDGSLEEAEISAETTSDAQLDLSDPAAIVTNWETIPAGTVIDAASIDFNNLSQYFVAYEISDEVYNYINGKSYQENPDVGLGDLRYFKLLHYNFNHELQVGELIVAADLQSDYIGIFTELFAAEYEIQSMYLPDRYWTGDPTTTDSASIDVNNTSCFMYRPATGSGKLSRHSYGRAIDINPQQNPYVSYTSGSPVWSHENANDYIDRTTGLPHVITEEDICYQIFMKYGFTWGGAWTNIKDYQHFQK